MTDLPPPLTATLRSLLVDLAREGRTISYLDLALAADMTPPQVIHRVTEALEILIREDHASGRPLLAALATRKAGDQPGRGFFLLLGELGLYDGPPEGPAAAECHARLLGSAIEYWSMTNR